MGSNTSTAAPLLAVHSVDEFAFSVPDLEQARHFYASFGLDVRGEDGCLALYTHGHAHRWGRIRQEGGRKRLLWISMGIHAEDAQRFERHLSRLNMARIAPPAGADAGGIWIAGPDGLALQLKVAPKSSPSAPSPQAQPQPGANFGRAPTRSKVQQVRPLYLSHLLMFSADVVRATRFYVEVLGLRVSDTSGDVIAFLHSPHGSDHHLIALAKSGGPGLHHTSWCVPSIDDVGLGMEQMGEAGYPDGWGVGRHVLGSNYFRYVRDPWGSYAEYSYDIDFVAPGAQWPAADHPPEDSLYVWGPAVPEDFVTNHELNA
ncbi:MAG TPA: VOC family protein [Alicycliphilus sp.]|nr:VOC family protein [Alicycliphilus sp.]